MTTSWPALTEAVGACEKCRLCQTRKHVVLGEGDPHAALMFIGEGPGQQEDETGRPFVGAAGQLLDRMLAAIGLTRAQVYICNIVKCRPPQNRVPEPDERAACLDYLRQQVALVRPKVIVCLGSTPTRALLGEDMRITRDRGTWQLRKGVWFMPTFHPAALLRDQDKKRPAWEDFKAIRAKLIELGVYEEKSVG
ncbi:MAG: uracil-DNA glycosylase [Clostridiales bacterium]|nr:uracil-DNA glycosylase [Clostridiales bacterium]MDY5349577.1 uracil-DNA glycosylase [Candidatus Ventricola sp.]MDY5515066.1 uracil-DNA glycosylase [Candidatus Ventricola sp.]